MIDNTAGGGESVALGLTRLSLRGFPLALVRQIPLSTSPLPFLFISIWPWERHQTKNTTRGQHRLCAMLTSALMKLIHISSVQPTGAQGKRGRGTRRRQRCGSVYLCVRACLCVCVCQRPLCSESPSWPGPLHMGFVLIALAERRGKWMLSELIGMTMGTYGCVCVAVWSWQQPYSSAQGCQVLRERTHWELTNHTQMQQTGSCVFCPSGGSQSLSPSASDCLLSNAG